MNNETFKKNIIFILKKIKSNRSLRLIYDYVQYLYLNKDDSKDDKADT